MSGFFGSGNTPRYSSTNISEPVVDENLVKKNEEQRLASKRGRRMNILVGDYIKRNGLGTGSQLGD